MWLFNHAHTVSMWQLDAYFSALHKFIWNALVYLPRFAGKFSVSSECCLVIKLPSSSGLFDKLKIKF